ncbi:MAG: GHMP kinase, partial [Acidobacteria bacterium]|nr:GHMP kinase [Acidobacteriota bacterium]
MRIFKTRAYARAGLVGNPSDGYHGRTISLIVKNFSADVVIYEWPELEIIPTRQDHCCFNSIADFLHDNRLNGYYGGLRLIKAAIKRFAEYCERENIALRAGNFSLRYSSNIPRQVGLAGSSAIVTATMRALCQFHDVVIPQEILPGLILSVEKDELGIGAGLQDRVAQVYEGLVYMDFDKAFMDDHGHGIYEPLDPEILPPIYVAYQTELAEPSEVFHNDIRKRYESGEKNVIDAMNTIAELARQARECLENRDYVTLAQLMNKNFDTRRSIYN